MKFEIYGREGCANCMTAKRILGREQRKNENITFEYLEYDEHKETLTEKFGEFRSLPVIILDGSESVAFQNLETRLKG